MKQQINARVYIDPEPETGAQRGYRGLVAIDALGVHLDKSAEQLVVNPEGWPDWEPIEVETLVPWHRVDLVEVTS